MDDVIICPVCHVAVDRNDYFCRNCGKNLRQKPLSITVPHQILIYLGSILLFPMGFIWGIRYVKEPNQPSKVVGFICLVISVVVLFIIINSLFVLINTVNQQINQQIPNMQGNMEGL
jgi:hypothetical protein